MATGHVVSQTAVNGSRCDADGCEGILHYGYG